MCINKCISHDFFSAWSLRNNTFDIAHDHSIGESQKGWTSKIYYFLLKDKMNWRAAENEIANGK